VFFLVVIGNGFHEHNLGTDILGNLFDLKFPEMGCLNLELSARHRDNAVLGGLNALSDFLAFTHVYLHGLSSMLTAIHDE
jgi:hypothetical protein